MDIIESSLLIVLVDSIGKLGTDTVDGSESVGAWAQVGDFSEKLEAVPLLLKRVGVVSSADQVNGINGNLVFLALALRKDELSSYSH